MEQELDQQQIESVLGNQVLGHLGCHSEGTTYVIPICYAYEDGYIYGRTYEGMKVKMIRKNPEVCFQVEKIENMAQWESVICWGRFEELTGSNIREEAIRKLQERITAVISSDRLLSSPYWPFSTPDAKGIIFRICINEKTGRASL